MKAQLFRHARLIDPATGHDAAGDLLVADRRIVAVGGRLDAPDAETIECDGAVLAPGLIDTGAFRADPEACVCLLYTSFPDSQHGFRVQMIPFARNML